MLLYCPSWYLVLGSTCKSIRQASPIPGPAGPVACSGHLDSASDGHYPFSRCSVQPIMHPFPSAWLLLKRMMKLRRCLHPAHPARLRRRSVPLPKAELPGLKPEHEPDAHLKLCNYIGSELWALHPFFKCSTDMYDVENIWVLPRPSPRLVVSRSTCPPLSYSPHANNFIKGTAVINTHRRRTGGKTFCVTTSSALDPP